MCMDAWNKAKDKLRNAERYLEMAGKLHTVKVFTRIHYQSPDGAINNCHECNAFDAALSLVVRKHFATMRDEALQMLRADVVATGQDARASVEKMLSQIDQYEAT